MEEAISKLIEAKKQLSYSSEATPVPVLQKVFKTDERMIRFLLSLLTALNEELAGHVEEVFPFMTSHDREKSLQTLLIEKPEDFKDVARTCLSLTEIEYVTEAFKNREGIDWQQMSNDDALRILNTLKEVHAFNMDQVEAIELVITAIEESIFYPEEAVEDLFIDEPALAAHFYGLYRAEDAKKAKEKVASTIAKELKDTATKKNRRAFGAAPRRGQSKNSPAALEKLDDDKFHQILQSCCKKVPIEFLQEVLLQALTAQEGTPDVEDPFPSYLDESVDKKEIDWNDWNAHMILPLLEMMEQEISSPRKRPLEETARTVLLDIQQYRDSINSNGHKKSPKALIQPCCGEMKTRLFELYRQEKSEIELSLSLAFTDELREVARDMLRGPIEENNRMVEEQEEVPVWDLEKNTEVLDLLQECSHEIIYDSTTLPVAIKKLRKEFLTLCDIGGDEQEYKFVVKEYRDFLNVPSDATKATKEFLDKVRVCPTPFKMMLLFFYISAIAANSAPARVDEGGLQHDTVHDLIYFFPNSESRLNVLAKFLSAHMPHTSPPYLGCWSLFAAALLSQSKSFEFFDDIFRLKAIILQSLPLAKKHCVKKRNMNTPKRTRMYHALLVNGKNQDILAALYANPDNADRFLHPASKSILKPSSHHILEHIYRTQRMHQTPPIENQPSSSPEACCIGMEWSIRDFYLLHLLCTSKHEALFKICLKRCPGHHYGMKVMRTRMGSIKTMYKNFAPHLLGGSTTILGKKQVPVLAYFTWKYLNYDDYGIYTSIVFPLGELDDMFAEVELQSEEGVSNECDVEESTDEDTSYLARGATQQEPATTETGYRAGGGTFRSYLLGDLDLSSSDDESSHGSLNNDGDVEATDEDGVMGGRTSTNNGISNDDPAHHSPEEAHPLSPEDNSIDPEEAQEENPHTRITTSIHRSELSIENGGAYNTSSSLATNLAPISEGNESASVEGFHDQVLSSSTDAEISTVRGGGLNAESENNLQNQHSSNDEDAIPVESASSSNASTTSPEHEMEAEQDFGSDWTSSTVCSSEASSFDLFCRRGPQALEDLVTNAPPPGNVAHLKTVFDLQGILNIAAKWGAN